MVDVNIYETLCRQGTFKGPVAHFSAPTVGEAAHLAKCYMDGQRRYFDGTLVAAHGEVVGVERRKVNSS